MLGGFNALVSDHHGTQAFFLLDEFRIFQRCLQGCIEFFQHGSRRALRGVQAVPDRDLEILQTGLIQRGNVFQRRRVQALERVTAKGLTFFASIWLVVLVVWSHSRSI